MSRNDTPMMVLINPAAFAYPAPLPPPRSPPFSIPTAPAYTAYLRRLFIREAARMHARSSTRCLKPWSDPSVPFCTPHRARSQPSAFRKTLTVQAHSAVLNSRARCISTASRPLHAWSTLRSLHPRVRCGGVIYAPPQPSVEASEDGEVRRAYAVGSTHRPARSQCGRHGGLELSRGIVGGKILRQRHGGAPPPASGRQTVQYATSAFSPR